ncbi:ATP phosphoribosyltransferase [Segniliparus rugosus]|uniref:ATP phosphoribosyltransferase n=1 Tax=Segniliparus rugosus (strain ATCC BAA-974 / DSM 45345 / CCUG 50838 / CIP 108380 / JCM 13579 / CDC 945) TaxID=679197 RepID=E5XSS8_SEGRC|nr:ATP phosphoribosyltransferase [Segniliparus rugosus]EFV12605.1 ATP phosphoribosyltransferase [Segniliparus rugosus ATCC BAA-974]
MLRVAVPNKGMISGPAADLLSEAGYRRRRDSKDLSVLDAANEVEFFFLRPRDIAVYVGSGDLDLGITGRDLALDAGASVRERLGLGFATSKFRLAAPVGQDWTLASLTGKRIATSLPNLMRSHLRKHGVDAQVVSLDGAVEISVQLGVADVVADVVDSGQTLSQHGLAPFGEPICVSEAVLFERDGEGDSAKEKAKAQLTARLQGVVFAQKYLMLDYDCPKSVLDEAVSVTPGLESPTIADLANPDWVAVRALTPRAEVNAVMDKLEELGAKAILASDVRHCRF